MDLLSARPALDPILTKKPLANCASCDQEIPSRPKPVRIQKQSISVKSRPKEYKMESKYGSGSALQNAKVQHLDTQKQTDKFRMTDTDNMMPKSNSNSIHSKDTETVTNSVKLPKINSIGNLWDKI